MFASNSTRAPARPDSSRASRPPSALRPDPPPKRSVHAGLGSAIRARCARIASGLASRSHAVADRPLSPNDQLVALLQQANAKPRSEREIRDLVTAITAFQGGHEQALTSTHVLSAVAGLGQGAMRPDTPRSVRILSEHLVARAAHDGYPGGDCAQAILALLESPPALSAKDRKGVLTESCKAFDALCACPRGPLTREEAGRYKSKLDALLPKSR